VVAVGFLLASSLARAVPAAAFRANWVGLGVLWAGVALRLWSIRTLGRYFTFAIQTSADQPLVTGGPYRVLRHPSYTGIWLAFVGVGVLFGNWLSLLVVAGLTLAGLVYRIRREERALTDALGERYRAYAATTKRLIPFIW
jgi:protein-S-isoprenylcysteine O-methyltransferase Ste14